MESLNMIPDFVNAGTATSIALFQVAADLGPAGADLSAIAAETSLLCSTVNQLRRRTQASPGALHDATQLLHRCKDVFYKLENLLNDLHGAKDGHTLIREKKAKLHVHCATLECSNIALTLMLNIVDVAASIAAQREAVAGAGKSVVATVDRAVPQRDAPEDGAAAIVFALIVTLRDALQRLKILEEDEDAMIYADEVDDNESWTAKCEPVSPPVPASEDSVWTVILHPLSHSHIASHEEAECGSSTNEPTQLSALLEKWTKESVPNRTSQPCSTSPETTEDIKASCSQRTGQDMQEPKLEIFKCMKREIPQEKTTEVIAQALKRYKLKASTDDYDLYIINEDQDRRLGPDEKPMILFKQISRSGGSPKFMLRRRNAEKAICEEKAPNNKANADEIDSVFGGVD